MLVSAREQMHKEVQGMCNQRMVVTLPNRGKARLTHRSQSPVSRRRLRTASRVSASVDMVLMI